MATAVDYERMVKQPGKFEGQARYVPYYWLQEYDDYVVYHRDYVVRCLRITSEDKQWFPELMRRKVVKLVETNDGFVVEVGR